MAKAVISYDRVLPEIPERKDWERPTQHLVKDAGMLIGWRVEEGRRESKLLLVPKIRTLVDEWREQGYPGASEVTQNLFRYWFDEDHIVEGFSSPFRYWYCQREAIETLIYLIEIANQRDVQKLIKSYVKVTKKDLFNDSVVFQTTMDGRRQIRRYDPATEEEGVQDLPPENLRRFAFKMATGSGKTWVMAMVVVWSHFHRKMVPGSDLSTNFLIVAPNVIVYQRLEKDFASNHIFNDLPIIPPEWRGRFSQKVILRGEATEPDPSGNLFLTNIQQMYESREEEWTPVNAVERMIGKKPSKDLASSGQRSMLERVKSVKDLIVMNDEAHHVHEAELEWTKSLIAIHEALPKGLAAWLDFSATPKDQNGMFFPWTICDYPLAQAVEDRIIKAPLIVTKEDDLDQPRKDPDHITANNVTDKYKYWLQAAVSRLKEHDKVFRKLGRRPVLFIMAEKTAFADKLGDFLIKEFDFRESEILVIHTDTAGEITKKDLDKAREAARDIDKPENKIRAIVSVMMLREGWDVRNVTIALGLRPFTADAKILPEQVIGRGVRLMAGISPDRTQTLEVLGTRNLLKVLREELETEGVGVASVRSSPSLPIVIEPIQERKAFDIAIPITKPSLEHDIRKLDELDANKLESILDQAELAETFRVRLKMEFATTESEVHHADIDIDNLPSSQDIVVSITKKVVDAAKLPTRFAEMYPLVREYIENRCFGKRIDVENKKVQSHLSRFEIQEGIAKYLARKISELTLERRTIEFEKADFKLSLTKPFSWCRNLLPKPLEAKKTVFNYVATYNNFERHFAQFLDKAEDVRRFASLGTTEQGESATQFRVDYLKPSGAIGFYYPDWVVIQKTPKGDANWIIETKGREWEGTVAKDEAIETWCTRVTKATGNLWQFRRINQDQFESKEYSTLGELIKDT